MPRGSRTELTIRQARFVEEYLVDRNAERAAMRAGYKRSVARCSSAILLKNPKVQAALGAIMARAVERSAVTVARLIEEYAALAFIDPALCFNADGTIKPVLEMPEAARRALTGLDLDRAGGFKRLRFAKVNALDSLAKIFDMIPAAQVQVSSGLAIHLHLGDSKEG